jgi:hypothetical protein
MLTSVKITEVSLADHDICEDRGIGGRFDV